MDFAFSADQEALRAVARDFLAREFPMGRVAELADSEAGWDRRSWKQIHDLGWLSLSVPEDDGGAGMGFLEEAVVFEETGHALYPGPLFSTLALARPALAESELLASVLGGQVTATLAWAEDGAPRPVGPDGTRASVKRAFRRSKARGRTGSSRARPPTQSSRAAAMSARWAAPVPSNVSMPCARL